MINIQLETMTHGLDTFQLLPNVQTFLGIKEYFLKLRNSVPVLVSGPTSVDSAGLHFSNTALRTDNFFRKQAGTCCHEYQYQDSG